MLAARMGPMIPKCLFSIPWVHYQRLGADSFLVRVGLTRFQFLERAEKRAKEIWDFLSLGMPLTCQFTTACLLFALTKLQGYSVMGHLINLRAVTEEWFVFEMWLNFPNCNVIRTGAIGKVFVASQFSVFDVHYSILVFYFFL